MAKNFLVELGTEELPPTSLLSLAKEFSGSIEKALEIRKLAFQSIHFFATPRRLAVQIFSLEEQAVDEAQEVFGPPLKIAFDENGNATRAAEAFAKKNGIPLEALQKDEDKGKLVYRSTVKGSMAIEALPVLVEDALNNLPIAKRMRWGAKRTEFVRPVKWLLMLFGEQVIDSSIYGVRASHFTRGHRFHANKKIKVDAPENYENLLEEVKVIADIEKRKNMIVEQVNSVARICGGTAVIDEALLAEVTALVEFPVALAGKFDTRFLNVPREALVSSMKEHQKYFHLVDKNDNLLPLFITLANIQSEDPSQVIAGNEKVIRPRLADATFFFEQDKKITLIARREKLKSVVFQAKLGTVYDKSERIKKLGAFIAEQLNVDPKAVEQTAILCKSDLVSNMVYEFPDMQGIAGYHYALHDGESSEVAESIREHYMPRFAGDALPASTTACIVALADRVDSICGIFGIGQTPSGSKDPFALRRASLGALRIMVEKSFPLDLQDLLNESASLFDELPKAKTVVGEVLDYMLERFRAWYEEAGISAEVFQAVNAKNLTTPLDINERVYAVAAFSKLSEASSLASANKRVGNILAKQGKNALAKVDSALLIETAEKELATRIHEMAAQVAPMFAAKRYSEALSTLAGLRDSVDHFFDKVMVMVEDEPLRNNRLALLTQLHALFYEVADISLLDVKKQAK